MAGTRYARGNAAWGTCAKSGQRMLLNDMVQDPFSGLLVHPDWAEPKLPLPPTDLQDAVVLARATPDLDKAMTATEIDFGEAWNWGSGEPFAPLWSSTDCTPPSLVVV